MGNATSLSIIRFSIFIFSLLLLISCSERVDDKNEPNPIAEPTQNIALVDKGIVTYTLDSLADFEYVQDLQINRIENKEYLSFYDRPTHSLYLHDYETGALKKKIVFAQEGPNAVNVLAQLQYHLHSFDSIFINTGFYGYFLINGKAEVLSRVKNNKSDSDYPGAKMQIKFDQSSEVSGGKIHGTIRGYYAKKIEHFPFLRGAMDFNSEKLTQDSSRSEALFDDYSGIIDFLKQAKKKGKLHVNIHRHVTRFDESIYATTILSDSIVVFKNQKPVRRIYAGLPDYKVTDYVTYLNNKEIIRSKREVNSKVVLKQPPLYISMQIDSQGKFIYRVVSHGTKAGIHPYDGSDIPVISGATLLVINLETEKHYRYELPIKEIDIATSFYNPHFVSNEGIHFRVKDQENEDEVQFRVFGMDNVH